MRERKNFKRITKSQPAKPEQATQKLFGEIRSLIETARSQVIQTVNATLVMLYWQIGTRILKGTLGEQRAEYGKQILQTLSAQLTNEYGKGFTYSALTRMVTFAEKFPRSKIVATLSQQLGWSHFVELIALEDNLQRNFYAEMCRIERWSVRTLRDKISSMLYERTAISKKPDRLIKQELKSLRDGNKLTPDLVFRDPYFLDFLGLKDTYSEKDLESAIVSELQRFIIELGTDFAFLARQRRITVDNEDYYIDLLFYHRKLRRLVVIDLKLGKFKAAYKSQMELYLNWLDKYERANGEESPVGLILCADKSDEHIELLMLNKGNIRVAQYLTGLPPKKLLEEKLHKAVIAAKERFEK